MVILQMFVLRHILFDDVNDCENKNLLIFKDISLSSFVGFSNILGLHQVTIISYRGERAGSSCFFSPQ